MAKSFEETISNTEIGKANNGSNTEIGKTSTSWECPVCHNVNRKDPFYCEECRTRNIATYG